MRHNALIILGPTGSGKTPFGDCLENKGLNGIPCHHFDFGFHLRRIAKFGKGSNLNLEDIKTVKTALKENILLENETFHIAEKILTYFQKTRIKNKDETIIMNGLPRHAGQADDLEPFIDVKGLICLDCTPETILIRIAADSGGDRAEREDDSLEEIQKKLKIFTERTAPLIRYYEQKGVPVIRVDIGIETQPEDIIAEITL